MNRQDQQRAGRVALGRCFYCPADRAPGDGRYCAMHREYRRDYMRAWYARTYVSRAGDRAKAPRGRLLRTLRFLEWTSAKELFALLNVSTENHGHNREYNTYEQALSRLARSPLVERRGRRNGYEYQITRAGRESLGPMRLGAIGARRRTNNAPHDAAEGAGA